MWGYDLKRAGKEDELTQIWWIRPPCKIRAPPLKMLRQWKASVCGSNRRKTTLWIAWRRPDCWLRQRSRQGTANRSHNMMITNNIDLPRPVRCRVLLTSPRETFSVGNTIVLSRGLVDVLPDEASLAMVLSHELAHIALGQNVGSKYAYNDRMLFEDENTYSTWASVTTTWKSIGRQEGARPAEEFTLRAEIGFRGVVPANAVSSWRSIARAA